MVGWLSWTTDHSEENKAETFWGWSHFFWQFSKAERPRHESCCLCFDRGYVSKSRIRNTNCKGTHRGQHLFHPMFAFSAHVSEPKKACFQDLRNSKFFCGFAVFTNFVKMWKSNFFLVFLNSLNSENPTFFWISWFPMVGPKPTDTGPKGFLKAWSCLMWNPHSSIFLKNYSMLPTILRFLDPMVKIWRHSVL